MVFLKIKIPSMIAIKCIYTESIKELVRTAYILTLMTYISYAMYFVN